MKFEVMFGGTGMASVEVRLDPNEEMLAATHAMVAMSPNVKLSTKTQGGFFAALGKKLTGNNFFTSKYTAQENLPGTLMLAPVSLGDIQVFELENHIALYLHSGAFLACSSSIELDTSWGGARGFFSGTGTFLLRAHGNGHMLFHSFGAMVSKTLGHGENFVVDNHHIVAFHETIGYRVKKATVGVWSTLTSGEGLVCEFTGPGTIWMQSRSEAAFVNWIANRLPPD